MSQVNSSSKPSFWELNYWGLFEVGVWIL